MHNCVALRADDADGVTPSLHCVTSLSPVGMTPAFIRTCWEAVFSSVVSASILVTPLWATAHAEIALTASVM